MIKECPSVEPSISTPAAPISDSEDGVEHMCQEEGAELICFLIMKANTSVTPSACPNIQEWTYQNIAHLAPAEHI